MVLALLQAVDHSLLPHGVAYDWQSDLVWLHVISDALIAMAYLAIPPTLLVLVIRARRVASGMTNRATGGLPYEWMFLAFGLFIVACGLTHVFGVWAVWEPVHWASGGMKVLTAVASIGTAIALPPLVPRAIDLLKAARDSESRRIQIERAHADLKEAHARIQEMSELKTEFFANVSHELRTPLTLVLGPTERLLAEAELDDPVREQLEVVRRNAGLLRRHVDDLLDVAAMEAGEATIEYAVVDLAALVRRVAVHFESPSVERGDRFVVETPDRLHAEVDPAKFERILLNLLSNAFRFTPAGGEISVRLATESEDGAPRKVVLEVSDSGPGVPESMRRKIFERFRQVQGGSARAFGGTGLGLAIAKEFVDLHGGDIGVGVATGGGARFRVVLPLRAPGDIVVEGSDDPGRQEAAANAAAQVTGELQPVTTAPEPTDEPVASHARGARILVVEDNAEMGRFVRDTLGAEYHTLVMERADAALEQLSRFRPDLIVADVMMPGMTGDELVRAIRSRRDCDDVPIVMLTAKADEHFRAELLRSGAQDYITKPFSLEELRARVANWIAVYRTRKVLQRELSSREVRIDDLAVTLAERSRETEAALREARAARERAEEADRAKADFLGVMSHELRTPLNAVLGYGSLLELEIDGPLTDGQKHHLERMETSVQQLLAIIEEILTFAKGEAGSLAVRLEPVEIEAVREAVEALEPAAVEKGLEMRVDLPRGAPPVRTDPGHLHQIVSNLVSNAVKFTESGRIEVSAATEADGGITLKVADTGIGIAAEQLEEIFDPFWRADTGLTRRTGGTGLGLTIVRRLTEELGGEIEVESVPERGTIFTVRLPGH